MIPHRPIPFRPVLARPILPRRGLAAGLAAALPLLLASTACSTAPDVAPEPLPFHVAVAPIDQPVIRVGSSVEHAGDTDMSLWIDPEALAAELARTLEERCFTRVTLLDGPVGGSDTPSGDRRRFLVERARAAGADLILECELEYETGIWYERNGNYWPNFLLFLMGGPFCYFLKDYTYHAEAELVAHLYDLNAIDNDEVLLGDRQARLVLSSVNFDGAPMNFVGRNGPKAGKYVVSVLIPSGLLSKETDVLEGRLRQAVVEELGDQLARGLIGKREVLARAGGPAPFYLDLDQLELGVDPDGTISLRGDVHLIQEGLIERMDRYRIQVDSGPVVEHGFGAPLWSAEPGTAGPLEALEQSDEELAAAIEASAPRYTGRATRLRYELDERIPATAGPHTVRLELEAGQRDRFVRSYTFEIGAAPAEETQR